MERAACFHHAARATLAWNGASAYRRAPRGGGATGLARGRRSRRRSPCSRCCARAASSHGTRRGTSGRRFRVHLAAVRAVAHPHHHASVIVVGAAPLLHAQCLTCASASRRPRHLGPEARALTDGASLVVTLRSHRQTRPTADARSSSGLRRRRDGAVRVVEPAAAAERVVVPTLLLERGRAGCVAVCEARVAAATAAPTRPAAGASTGKLVRRCAPRALGGRGVPFDRLGAHHSCRRSHVGVRAPM